MTITQEIAFWKAQARDAKTKEAALVAQGVAMGLQIAKNEHLRKSTPN